MMWCMQKTYTLPEAARVLRLTPQQLSDLLSMGGLEVIADKETGQRRVTQRSVHLAVESQSRADNRVTYPEYRSLVSRLARLEDHFRTVTAVLQAPAPPRVWEDEELLLLLEYAYNMTALGSFSPNDMHSFAERLLTLRWEEVGRLSELRGEGAWRTIFGLINDMLRALEAQNAYPEEARILGGQLNRALDYLIGLFGTARVFKTDLPDNPTIRLADTLHVPMGSFDDFIVSAIKAKAAAISSEAWTQRIRRERS